MIPPGAVLCLAGIVLVRHGWQRSRRSAVAGWAAVGAGLSVLAHTDGAWGLAVGASVAILAALMLLAHAAITSPAGLVVAGREARPVPVPIPALAEIGLRAAVFVIVAPLGLVLSMGLAWTAQRAALAGGWGEADATVLALLLGPIGWAVLATWQMTRAGIGAMLGGAAAMASLALLTYIAVR